MRECDWVGNWERRNLNARWNTIQNTLIVQANYVKLTLHIQSWKVAFTPTNAVTVFDCAWIVTIHSLFNDKTCLLFFLIYSPLCIWNDMLYSSVRVRLKLEAGMSSSFFRCKPWKKKDLETTFSTFVHGSPVGLCPGLALNSTKWQLLHRDLWKNLAKLSKCH